ncbi:DUF3710 domain-containing protein [Schaalia sp. 19OD2882]|uniref:DUF3710 domain-containing protein n=1 Tax=Schaalia sp. 19OD2882 TaxID=2794089 RepID=UPI001C1E92F6|nr:DUF3710 domain-containing protein [Schaalia sp. 19OD2882]QWW20434.1 DUF3710 domain-containing protein [Schaalia sp. 19OD2882]
MFSFRSRSAHSRAEESAPRRLPTLRDPDRVWSQPGPRDASEVNHSVGYIDMGSLCVPAVPGMQVQTQMADDKQSVVRVMLVLGTSGLQISLAAAPRSGGVWDELRSQIIGGLQADGARVEQVKGRYGTEILADVPVTTPDGGTASSRMRIIGREGPRWFARIDVLGPAVSSQEDARNLEQVIDRLVVVRDQHPRARLDLLPIHLPEGAGESSGV